MPDEPRVPAPVSLSRAALERVLARAAELQAASGEGDDLGDLSEEQLIEVGKEVGLSHEHLRQALAEERSRAVIPEERGWLGALAGIAVITAARTVPGMPAPVLASLDAWMQRSEALQIKRRFSDQLVWEPRAGFLSAMRRALRAGGRGYDLTPAQDVSAVVAPVGPDRVHVRLVANFGETRSRRVGLAGIASVATLITGAPLLVIGVTPVLAAIPPLVLASATLLMTQRQYRRLITRAQVALEQALDRLEFGDPRPTSPAQALLNAIVGQPRLPK